MTLLFVLWIVGFEYLHEIGFGTCVLHTGTLHGDKQKVRSVVVTNKVNNKNVN